jgi:hypothetical protein
MIVILSLCLTLGLISSRQARDTAEWFANEFRRAMMPLYSIQQGVIHSGYFDSIRDEIEKLITDSSDKRGE